MVSLTTLFWMFVILFAGIGMMRGWAKEMLVSISAILAMFIIALIPILLPKDLYAGLSPETRFWIATIITVVLVFFGYQSPKLIPGESRFAREKFRDALVGLFLGGLNAWLVYGSIWWYMNETNYPLEAFLPPNPDTDIGQAAIQLLQKMPPDLVIFQAPWLYGIVALSLLLLIIFFI